ncbi:MAG TPA: cobalamin-binding protein [Gemmatimonadaceae bacterium]|nr:cobalamin-binding protein [Gemmatimonadaceae bacterium]
MPRIVSFLPSATEIACTLGAGGDLVGRSHECDFPPEVKALPIVSKPALEIAGLTQGAIDSAVASQLASGASLYVVDEVLLRELDPEVVFTQDLCQVCAPSGTELTRALKTLRSPPEVLWLTPRNLSEIEENILDVGRVTGRASAGRELVGRMRSRIAQVRDAVCGALPRRVVFMEWTEPPFAAGHWVPEMIGIAGGVDPNGRASEDSVRITWESIVASSPEIVIVAPCGYGLTQATAAAEQLSWIPNARVIAVDANAYFARPGPRVIEGIELLAHLFHPDRFDWPYQERPWAEIPCPDRR